MGAERVYASAHLTLVRLLQAIPAASNLAPSTVSWHRSSLSERSTGAAVSAARPTSRASFSTCSRADRFFPVRFHSSRAASSSALQPSSCVAHSTASAVPGTVAGSASSLVSRRAVDTCALTARQRLAPRSHTSVHASPVHGGKSSSSSCGYCESHWMAAPRLFMSKSMTKIEPAVLGPPE